MSNITKKQNTYIAENLAVIIENAYNKYKYIISRYKVKKVMEEVLDDDEYMKFINIFINKYRNNKICLYEIACVIHDLKKEWQIYFAKALIDNKVDIDIFKTISVFSYPSSWLGSTINIIDEIIDTINAFLQQTPLKNENLPYLQIIKEKKIVLKNIKLKYILEC